MDICGLFPGQGSQDVGMGLELMNSFAQAKEIFSAADGLLGFELSKLCFQGPAAELNLTKNGQPAILLVSYVSYQLSGIKLAAAAGHSLGEYTALVAAGAISFEDAIQLVHKRGCYMQEAVPEGEGKMLAVLGLTESDVREVIDSVEKGIVEVANLNSAEQIVIAGDNQGVDGFVEAAKSHTAKLIPLKVSAPFHCSLMQPAADALAKDLDAISFSDLAFPVYANVTAEPVVKGEDAKDLLKRQVCASVRWTDSMLNLINAQKPNAMLEFGPGGVLSKLLKRIDRSVKAHQIFNPESLTKAQEALG